MIFLSKSVSNINHLLTHCCITMTNQDHSISSPNINQSLSSEEREELLSNFSTFVDKDGLIEVHNLLRAYKTKSIPKVSYEDIMNAVKTVKKSSNVSELTKDEFFQVASIIKPKSITSRGSTLPQKHASRITSIIGSTDAYQHYIDDEEKIEFTNHINAILSSDPDVSRKLPIPIGQGNELFEACKDGLILCKLINHAVKDTIDERVLNKASNLSMFHMTENNNVAVNSAKAIGCSIVNIGSEDIIHGKQHLVLGLIWQIIKMGLFAKITLRSHPELYRLLESNETIDELLKLPPDMILLRWFNYHLKQAKHNRKVSNFSSDVQDSECYTILLNQLCPKKCSLDPLRITDPFERAESLLKNAESIDCRRYVTATSICSGNPKLNLAFVANLFNTHPGLAPLEPQEQANIDETLFGGEGDREARAFALWLNSLNVDPFVYNIFFDLRDGRVLIQAIDKIHPNLVQFTKVNMTSTLSRFKCIENTNYVIHLGKDILKFSLVGTQGADLTDGNRVLTLGMVWQLMRYHILRTLRSISPDGKEPTEADLIKWANESVSKCHFYSTPIQSFRDPRLADGMYLLALLSSIRQGCINTGLISHVGDTGQGENSSKLSGLQASQLNAKYAIGVARKIGATIFLLPEDIVEVKPKMILTFVGSLMAVASRS